MSQTAVQMREASVPAGEPEKHRLAGDFWGGLAAMLVALPSAIAFGVIIFSPLGGTYSAQGALAGLLGATAVGLVASIMGGTNSLISAPSAPAAAVMSAFAVDAVRRGIPAGSILPLLVIFALACGAVQVLFGAVRLGGLIKYLPYPVVSGYMSGVGLIIISSQVPRFLGTPRGMGFGRVLTTPSLWNMTGIVVGVVTIAVMVTAPRFTRRVPAAIIALGAGLVTYFLLALANRSLLSLFENPLVVGPLVTSGAGFSNVLDAPWKGVRALTASQIAALITPALTLAVLLSIDTLKTCIVVDTITRTRHNSNRELIGQGLANMVSGIAGGVPGSGTMGASLLNISSGGTTRLSGIAEGALSLAAFLALGKLIAWVPIPALAGILIVIGFRMIDRNGLNLLRSRSTLFDFAVIVAVVVVAGTASLIAASAVGIGLAILLFIREQVGTSVIRRKTYGNVMFSKQVRLPAERGILEKRGEATVIFELQGSLFFGTTHKLFAEIEPELKTRKVVILDMRRVQTVDITAVHVLEQIENILCERGSALIFSDLPHSLPTGRDLQSYFDQVGLVRPACDVRIFGELDEALEWVENRILAQEHERRASETPLELHEIELFRGRKRETLAALESCMETRAFKAGENVFTCGEDGDDLFLIRRGEVRIMLPLGRNHSHHLATFSRGDFFGEMSFLDHAPRSADAVALTDTEVFVLSRERFNCLAAEHRMLGMNLMEALARAMAVRLRHSTAELRALQDA